ncbi:MAG: NUDIX domain-containing protein [Gemmatimonadota bacterium]
MKRSVSVAIRHPEDSALVLQVRRPPDDEGLPNAWGLPAATLREGERWEEAAVRAGREKLGVELALAGELKEGSIVRPDASLEMKLFDATIARGEPDVSVAPAGVTRYTAWRWGHAEDLRPAAERGSLCCRLYLETSDG